MAFFQGAVQDLPFLGGTQRQRRLSAGLEVAVIVLLVGEAQSTALTQAGRLASMAAHVGHQEQSGPEPLPTFRTFQHPLVSSGVFFELLCRVECLAALQTTDLVCLGLGFLVAPAASVNFVLLEVLLTEELSQTRDAVEALGFAPVVAVEPGQAEVTAATDAGVRQQAQVGEAVFQERVLLSKGVRAVRTSEDAVAPLHLVARQQLLSGKAAGAHLASKIDATHALVHFYVALAVLPVGEDAFAQVALVKLLLEVRLRQVFPQASLGGEAQLADPAAEAFESDLGVSAQVDAVAVDVAETLPTLGTAVGPRSRVHVHVVLEFESGGQLELANAADVSSRTTRLTA